MGWAQVWQAPPVSVHVCVEGGPPRTAPGPGSGSQPGLVGERDEFLELAGEAVAMSQLTLTQSGGQREYCGEECSVIQEMQLC